jgi:pseudaminic acid synthase
MKSNISNSNGRCTIVAEISGNHNQSFSRAADLIYQAAEAGADAIKLQTYTPDTITIDCKKDFFKMNGTVWKGSYLYDLYKTAYTPWEWQSDLFDLAEKSGLECFSSVFDESSVDFLEEIGCSRYKIASSEIIDMQLLECVADTKKPIIISTGMASLPEIEEAVLCLGSAKSGPLTLLKCTSAYPADEADMNLLTMSDMRRRFEVDVGLSDHTLGTKSAMIAVAMGACMVEKHLTLRRSDGGPDASFSMEPEEFKKMVDDIRLAEKIMGEISYGPTVSEAIAVECRRSIFVIKDIRKGEYLTLDNLRSIRPGHGLAPKHLKAIIDGERKASMDLEFGTPLDWKHIR